MLKVGLTGGIGAGKSTVAQIFIHLGIPVFNADTEASKILDQNTEVRHQLTDWFGPDIFIDGRPDRKKLAGLLFNDPELLGKMNGLIHPLVFDHFVNWCNVNQSKPYLIHEAAILFESGFYKNLDANILVIAPENIRILRVKQRDKTTEKAIRERMQNQWTDDRKSSLADYIITNDGVTPLIPRILELHRKLTE
jgi:dephospho-CoA kinase